MLTIPEYNVDAPTLITGNDVMGDEARWFEKQLERIAGKNPHGRPMLQLVWGVTHRDPMSTDPDAIKYLDFIREGKQYGERRFFVEIWRSPEFLARSGRYQAETRQDEDGTTLLKSLPSDGCYDYWLRLEKADIVDGQLRGLIFHAPDRDALEVVEALWKFEQMPQSRRDELERANRELERRQMIAAMRNRRNELWGFDITGHQPIIASDQSVKLVKRLVEI